MQMLKRGGLGAGIMGLLMGFLAVAFFLSGCSDLTPAAMATSEPVIEYLAPENVVWVRSFSRDAPATMDDVLAADRKAGWNRIAYEPAGDTYTLKASLWIGGVSAWDPTFVQIGRPGHERETLIVKGFVWIRPPRKNLPGADGKSGLVNRLTLGNQTNAAIRATLKIDCQTTVQSDGLFIGDRSIPGQYAFCGGDLFVFNSVIAAAPADPKNQLPVWVRTMDTGCYGTDVRLIGATVSRIGLYGINPGNSTIERTLFENGRSIFTGGFQRAVDCVFRNLACPVSGDLVELIRCTFESNAVNWSLQNMTGYGVEAIDCRMGPPKNPVQLRKNTGDPRMLLNNGIPVYPFYIERRSLAVKVADAEGHPIAAAVISLSCPEESPLGVGAPTSMWGGPAPAGMLDHLVAMRNSVAVTDHVGVTPRKAEEGALLPAVRRWRATDDPLKPREEKFSYRITVEAAGYRPVERMLTPDELATNVVTVILQGLR